MNVNLSYRYSSSKSLYAATGMFGALLLAVGLLISGDADSFQATNAPFTTLDAWHSAPLGTIVIVLGAALAWGWPRLLNMPSAMASRVVMLATALACPIIAAYSSVRALAYLVAFIPLVVFVAQMFRRDGRVKLLRHVAGTYAGCLVIVASSGWVFLGRTEGGSTIGILVCAMIFFGSLALYLAPSQWNVIAAGVMGAIVAAVGTAAFHATTWPATCALVVVYAAVAWACNRLVRLLQVLGHDAAASALAFVPHCVLGVLTLVLSFVA